MSVFKSKKLVSVPSCASSEDSVSTGSTSTGSTSTVSSGGSTAAIGSDVTVSVFSVSIAASTGSSEGPTYISLSGSFLPNDPVTL